MAGKPKHMPTDELRNQVAAMISYGVPQLDIAKVIGIDKKTLYKYYREELDTAAAVANSKVAGILFKKCMEGDTTCLLFWAKTKMGWSEHSKIDHTSSDGSLRPPKIVIEHVTTNEK